MDWNWLFIIILLIIAVYTIRGYRRGMLRVLFSLGSMLITIFFVAWASPYISGWLKENTPVYQKIEKSCEEKIREKMQAQIEEETEQAASSLEEYGIALPKSLEGLFSEKAQKGTDSILENSGAYTVMAQQMAQLAVDGLAFLIALIICGILLHFLGNMIDIVSRIPVLKGVNRILGLAAGLLQGLVIVWILFYFVAVTQAFPLGQEMYRCVESNRYLKYLYENNMLLYIIRLFL